MNEISIGPFSRIRLEEANRMFNVAFGSFCALRTRLLFLAIAAFCCRAFRTKGDSTGQVFLLSTVGAKKGGYRYRFKNRQIWYPSMYLNGASPSV